MISNKVVLTAEHYLFGDIVLPEGFHKKLFKFMLNAEFQTHCVVLYKPLAAFKEFLEQFPELPDIGRKEFLITRNGTLQFTPDYFTCPLEEIFVINFITDGIVREAIKHLFGATSFTSFFHKEFKKFIQTHYGKSDKIVLSDANTQFMKFLAGFDNIPALGKKQLVIYGSGKMFFSSDPSLHKLEEISLKTEEQ